MRIFYLLPLCFLWACTVAVPEAPEGDLTPAEPTFSAEMENYLNLNHLQTETAGAIKIASMAATILSDHCEGPSELCPFVKKFTSPSEPRERFHWTELNRFQQKSLLGAARSLSHLAGETIILRSSELTAGACPRMLTAAAILKLEDLLPDFRAWESMKKLFTALQECPVEAKLEPLYLRMALYFYAFQNLPAAQAAIQLALSLPAPEEKARILYWGGFLLEDPGLWQELVQTRPYTFHAIIVSQKLKLNLWNLFANRQTLTPERRETFFTETFEKLLFHKQLAAAFELLNDNLREDFLAQDPNYLFYLVNLLDRQGRTDYLIRLTTRIAHIHPQIFNTQFIRLSYKHHYLKLFQEHAPSTDPFLMLALSKQESGFFERATSRAKAKGLMQLLPSTARVLNPTKAKDLYNADNNIALGSQYFQDLFRRYNQVELALAAYNAGPHRVDRWKRKLPETPDLLFLDLIPFKETRNYVSTILRNNFFYRKLLGSSQDWEIESKLLPTATPAANQNASP